MNNSSLDPDVRERVKRVGRVLDTELTTVTANMHLAIKLQPEREYTIDPCACKPYLKHIFHASGRRLVQIAPAAKNLAG